MRPSTSRRTTLIKLSLCGYLLLSAWQGLTPTYGLTPQAPSCLLRDLQVRSFVATPASIAFGTSATLTWQVFVPQGCFSATLDVNGQDVSPQGQRTIQPLYNTTYRLRATYTPENGGAPQVRI